MRPSYRRWIYAKPMTEDVLRPDQFELQEHPLPDPEQGQALVRVKLINVHAHTRLHLSQGRTPIGDTVRGNYACAEVVRSRVDGFENLPNAIAGLYQRG